MQFGEKLGLPQDIACLGLGSNISMDPQSSSGLSLQIDLPSFLSTSEFIVFKNLYFKSESLHVNSDGEDTRCETEIVAPGNKVPKWFNHQSIESSISFWVGPKFPTFAFCIAFHLVPLKNSYANNEKCGSLRDDIISWVCVVNISINGHMQPFMRQPIFQGLKCDHLWFYGVPQSQLQQKFGDLLQGDQNHVEVSCKISHWTSEFGKFAPVVARMGVHVECICPPQNVDEISELAPLLPSISTSNGLRRRRTSTSYNP